jgi:chromosomal replication initiator protein
VDDVVGTPPSSPAPATPAGTSQGPASGTDALRREVQAALRSELLQGVGRSRYRLWFRDVDVAQVDGECLTLAVPTEVHRSWIEYTFGEVVRSASERVLGRGVRVALEVGEAQRDKRALRERLPQGPGAWEQALSASRPVPTFTAFVAARQERWAVTLLEQLVHGGGEAGAPPIYLYGEPGSGKSHLLHALERGVAHHTPGACLLLKARRFVERVAQAHRPGAPGTAPRALEADLGARRLLLVDGVDALAGRARSEGELARWLDRSARGGGPRLVLSGSRHPREIPGLDAALASRLCGGLVVRLPVPDRTQLGEVLRLRHAAQGLEAPPDVVQQILDVTTAPAAAVLWLDRWAVASRALGRSLEASWLAEVSPPAQTSVGDDVVLRAKRLVATHFQVEADVLDRATKRRSAALPRGVAVWLVWRATAMPLTRLARAFGFRSHSSVSRALGGVKRQRQDDVGLEQTLDGLLARL